MVFHYGQEIFEGLKAYRQPDGSVGLVPGATPTRPGSRSRPPGWHAAGARELFLASLRELVRVDEAWVPAAGGEDSLYLRPF